MFMKVCKKQAATFDGGNKWFSYHCEHFLKYSLIKKIYCLIAVSFLEVHNGIKQYKRI